MDGIHDLGGMHGFGPVPIKKGDYVFKADWQRRAFALAEILAGPAHYGADQHRQAIERMPAVDYLRLDYFEKWMVATEALLIEAGLVNAEELRTGRKLFDVDLSRHRKIGPENLISAVKSGAELSFPDDTRKPHFALGDRVRMLTDSPAGHTRSPRYLRGRTGEIVAGHGVFQFADAMAAGRGAEPQHCYTVAFTAREVWGRSAEEAQDMIHADMWESYLEPA
ncbi:nitrile hydratase subunit beta [Nordella sp. HKS 07]|uniref:nitrile hydratase subunit beta n=1 Tax=Nordella sp. HKS 07 TaxID=2712222 RepID=UPI0013E10555|nr:nitrile hydratase subunit beta [Nordella sp. HKS 07]QIG49104.1 nitrile hydratase subunit beta [Nordella sp. HKS 07]